MIFVFEALFAFLCLEMFQIPLAEAEHILESEVFSVNTLVRISRLFNDRISFSSKKGIVG